MHACFWMLGGVGCLQDGRWMRCGIWMLGWLCCCSRGRVAVLTSGSAFRSVLHCERVIPAGLTCFCCQFASLLRFVVAHEEVCIATCTIQDIIQACRRVIATPLDCTLVLK